MKVFSSKPQGLYYVAFTSGKNILQLFEDEPAKTCSVARADIVGKYPSHFAEPSLLTKSEVKQLHTSLPFFNQNA